MVLWRDAPSQDIYETKGNFAIHVVPLALIDPNPRIRIGIEYHGFNKLGYSLDVGLGKRFLKDLSLTEGPWGNQYTFFEIHPELKWYTLESGRFESYLSLELFYSILTDQLSDNDYYEESDSQNFYFEQASFSRHKIGLLLKVGNKWHFAGPMFFDMSAGFGIAYRDISYDDVTGMITNDFNTGEWFLPPYKKEGNFFVPQFAVNMKFGVILK